jgi:hypothetical protein
MGDQLFPDPYYVIVPLRGNPVRKIMRHKPEHIANDV